ncbi:hypothetical protein Q4E93_02280 [Flavitalea sp. BT771]|uniref:hypothetical protein n=1 Tax=Flavitalea sp. BT771 TaxID=3063329 RepID=UPI0026E2C631|nr:hypothetical protein [Flavitalea sp. BT771]MDO6429398.1 hypothetical protein [Flavitalea sp. BT771]MDV6218474.1 hypothetical protein [Flavitalea sp. BT771]
MAIRPLAKTFGYIYLCCIPVLTFIFAFALGHITYKLYIPIWLLNFCIMVWAVWALGSKAFRAVEKERRYLAYGSCLLILTICLLSILFGMGAPPGTIQEWVDTATEQKARFDILLADGILVALGLSLIKLVLQEKGEKLYTQLGYTAIVIAIPLFFINTSFWHSFALQAFKIKIANGIGSKPQEWYAPAAQQIWIITIGQVLLTYFSVAMFASSLRQTKIFRRVPAGIYITFSIVAIVSILLFPLYPGASAFSGFPYYPFMIPAVPIMLCYYVGVNLLRNSAAG